MSQETGSNLESTVLPAPQEQFRAFTGVTRWVCGTCPLCCVTVQMLHGVAFWKFFPPTPRTFQIFLPTRLRPAVGVGGACRHTKTHSPQDRVACLQSHQLSSPWGPLAAETRDESPEEHGDHIYIFPTGVV